MPATKMTETSYNSANDIDKKGFMRPKKSWNSIEKTVSNSFALKRTFMKKLNRENAVAKKEKILKNQLFVQAMQHA